MSFDILHSCYPPLDKGAFKTFFYDYYTTRKEHRTNPLLPGVSFHLTPLDLTPFFLPAASGILNSLKLGDTSLLSSKDLKALGGVWDEIIRVKLKYRLAGGPRMWAQVWRVHPQKGLGFSPPISGSTPILKLYHDARYRAPAYEDIFPHKGNKAVGISKATWIPSPVAAARECVAYSRLQDLQGKCVARMLGTFTVTLLGGAPIAALLMTKVPGTAFTDAITLWHEDEARIIMIIDAFASTLCRIHKGGVIHRDLKSAHVRVKVDEVRNEVKVQILDFGLAHILPQDFEYDQQVQESPCQPDPFEIDYESFSRLVWSGIDDPATLVSFHSKPCADAWLKEACDEGNVFALALRRYLNSSTI